MSIRGLFAALSIVLAALLFCALPGNAMAAPTLQAKPSAYAFGTMLVDGGYDFSYDYVELENPGPEPVEITGISISGADAPDFGFSISGPFGYCAEEMTLAQGETCFIDVDVSVESAGTRNASLDIDSNVAGGVTAIPLSANLVEAATNAPVFGAEQVTPGLDDGDGSGIWSMTSGVLGGTGIADVLASVQMGNYSDTKLGVFNGEPDGSFADPAGFGLSGGFPGSTAVGDFDGGDGPDVVSTSSGQASIFLNDGEGGLTEGTPVAIEQDGGSVAVGDFNEDDKDDFAVSGSSSLEVYLGNGDGSFQPRITQELDDSWVIILVTADFEGDGSSDLGYTNYDTGGVVMMESNGDGTFTELDRIQGCGCESAEGLASSDLNGDGRDDLVAALRFENKVSTYLALADGQFERKQTFRLPLQDGLYDTNPIAVVTGDLNGDGIPDAVTANYLSDSKTVLVGNGNGSFGFASQEYVTGATGPRGVTINQFSDDPKMDIALGGQYDGSVSSFINIGDPGQVPDPTSLDFGGIPAGYESPVETVDLVNEDGLAPLVVNSVADGGGSSGDFDIVDSSDCTDAPVLVGDSCSVELIFDPTGPPGSRDTTLYFNTNHSEEPEVQVPLAGTALSEEPSGTVAPASLDFGSVTVGETSTSPGIVLTNSGFVPLDVGTVTLEGSNAGDFTVGGGCDAAMLIEPGDFCTIATDFTPSASGNRSASIRVTSDAAGGDIVVPLSGSGVARPVLVPEISVQPASLAFDSTQVGSETAAKSVTVTSSGTAPLVLGQVSLGGTSPGDFPAGTNSCAGTLQPGAKCTVAFRFKPTASGPRSATLTVASNAAGGTTTVPLSGTATAKPSAPAPKVSFKKKPKKKYVIRGKKLKQVKVAFRSSQSGSKFQCRIDGRKFSGCKSPKVFRNIKPGKHVIRVRAKKAGKTGPAKAVKFRVVRRR